MMSSWTKKLVIRVAIFTGVSGTILGGAWLASGGGRQGEKKQAAGKKPEIVEGEKNKLPAESLKTNQNADSTPKEVKATPSVTTSADKPAAVAENPAEEAKPEKGKEIRDREREGDKKEREKKKEREDDRKKFGKKPEKDD